MSKMIRLKARNHKHKLVYCGNSDVKTASCGTNEMGNRHNAKEKKRSFAESICGHVDKGIRSSHFTVLLREWLGANKINLSWSVVRAVVRFI